jgi:hypothetical protein
MEYWKPKPGDKPDFFIPPRESFVLQIKCAELVINLSFDFPTYYQKITFSSNVSNSIGGWRW